MRDWLYMAVYGVGVNLYGLLAEKVLDGINNLLLWAAFTPLQQ
jgi:hypothetical protein